MEGRRGGSRRGGWRAYKPEAEGKRGHSFDRVGFLFFSFLRIRPPMSSGEPITNPPQAQRSSLN